MASTNASSNNDPVFCEYFYTLDGSTKERYRQKVVGFDPYCLKKSDYSEELRLYIISRYSQPRDDSNLMGNRLLISVLLIRKTSMAAHRHNDKLVTLLILLRCLLIVSISYILGNKNFHFFIQNV